MIDGVRWSTWLKNSQTTDLFRQTSAVFPRWPIYQTGWGNVCHGSRKINKSISAYCFGNLIKTWHHVIWLIVVVILLVRKNKAVQCKKQHNTRVTTFGRISVVTRWNTSLMCVPGLSYKIYNIHDIDYAVYIERHERKTSKKREYKNSKVVTVIR